ncbi:hypothetical protein GALMADRAFT_143306 [Galerina marginata CBS 339.88]|uniref:ATPase AAA-type core domain-containing protein n=1 Tax=Galerina marginata (strain CBS 339.88) TaxID=685588 RepID=A0A067SM54_GALM3|nr:hypothetical protein GALMADRAFT_143306 [Galerina marginata CBS 339.88]
MLVDVNDASTIAKNHDRTKLFYQTSPHSISTWGTFPLRTTSETADNQHHGGAALQPSSCPAGHSDLVGPNDDRRIRSRPPICFILPGPSLCLFLCFGKEFFLSLVSDTIEDQLGVDGSEFKSSENSLKLPSEPARHFPPPSFDCSSTHDDAKAPSSPSLPPSSASSRLRLEPRLDSQAVRAQDLLTGPRAPHRLPPVNPPFYMAVVVRELKRVETENPLVLVDEVDKIVKGMNGGPRACCSKCTTWCRASVSSPVTRTSSSNSPACSLPAPLTPSTPNLRRSSTAWRCLRSQATCPRRRSPSHHVPRPAGKGGERAGFCGCQGDAGGGGRADKLLFEEERIQEVEEAYLEARASCPPGQSSPVNYNDFAPSPVSSLRLHNHTAPGLTLLTLFRPPYLSCTSLLCVDIEILIRVHEYVSAYTMGLYEFFYQELKTQTLALTGVVNAIIIGKNDIHVIYSVYDHDYSCSCRAPTTAGIIFVFVKCCRRGRKSQASFNGSGKKKELFWEVVETSIAGVRPAS